MSNSLPPLPQKGDTIGIFAPCSYVVEERFHQGVDIIRARGYDVYVHPQTYKRQNQSAGTVAEKLAAFQDLLSDPKIKAIWAASGGNRAQLMLPHLNPAMMASHPKIFLGFSNNDALANGAYINANMAMLYAPTVSTLYRIAPESVDSVFDWLTGQKPALNATGVRDGSATGKLIGGNLSTISSLAGTPYMPTANGAILLLEEVGEEISRIDRLITQLKFSMPFEKLAGIVFGSFTHLIDTGKPFGWTIEDLIRDHTQGLNIPVAMNAPFGHDMVFHTLPLGGTATLTVKGTGATLSF